MARSRAANREKYPNVPRLAWTIDELCTAANCSRSFYEKEKRNGRAGAAEHRVKRPDGRRGHRMSHVYGTSVVDTTW